MAGSEIRIVCFDLGRVLIRLCDNWRHACAVAGVVYPEGEMDEAKRAAVHEAVCRNELGETDLQAFARETAELFGVKADEVERLYNAYLREPYPGVVELLEELKARGVKMACLSNTNAAHWEAMIEPAGPYGGVMGRIDHRFASHLLGLRKPDPACFRAVERAMHCLPQQILFFDDNEGNITGARACGWHAYRIDPAADPAGQMRSRLGALGLLSTGR